MAARITLRQQLLQQIIPRVLLLLVMLSIIITVAFYIIAERQLKQTHESRIETLRIELNTAINSLTANIENTANNHLLHNSLVDFQKRQEYLPLFFQSLKFVNHDDVSQGLFDFAGDYIITKNWEEHVPTELATIWYNEVLEKGNTYTYFGNEGLLIGAPLIINGMAEGALVVFIANINNIVSFTERNKQLVLLDNQLNILFSTQPDTYPPHTQLPETLRSRHFYLERPWENFKIVSFEPFSAAYADTLWLFPILLVSLLTTVLGSVLGVRMAAGTASNTLRLLRDDLEREVRAEYTQGEHYDNESTPLEFIRIRESFTQLISNVTSLSLSNAKIVNVINSMQEVLLVINNNREVILSNLSYSNFIHQTDNFNKPHQIADLFIDESGSMLRQKTMTYQSGESSITLNWRATPLRDNDGKTIGTVFVGDDITVQEALAREVRLRSTAMDEATVSIVIADVTAEDQPIVYANRAFTQLTGYDLKDIIGVNCRMLQGPKTERAMLDQIKTAVAAKKPTEVTLTNYKKNGEKFSNRLILTPVLDEDSNATHYIGIQQDVTMQQQTALYLADAKQKAEESARLQSRFLASMSHEIRTPINGIFGMLQLISKGSLSTEQERYVGLAEESTQNLIHLINDILDFSKIEAGKLAIESVNFDLVELLSKVEQTYALTCNEKQINLAFKSDFEHLRYVQGDPYRLRQILNNLLNNAFKFTERGSIKAYFKLESHPSSKACVLTARIQDSGIGIAPDKLDSIFQVFNQEDSSTTRKFGGSGLGLSICKQLCQLMGGDIYVEQSQKGKGSTFKFWITLNKGEQPEAIENTVENMSSNANKKRKKPLILVVEDNEINRIVAVQHLQNYKVVTAENGQKALDALQGLKPEVSLILMDCQMPEMDGFVATRLIRNGDAGERYQQVPIIALTANAMKGDQEACFAAGMNDYLTKPFDSVKLIEKIEYWLQK